MQKTETNSEVIINKYAFEETRFRDFESGVIEKSESDRTITHYISTPHKDRVGDIVNPKGMDSSEFDKTRTVFYNHNYGTPIGKNLWLKRKDDGVLAKTFFSKTDFANDIFTLHKEGVINTWSIGFKIPKLKDSTMLDQQDNTFYINKWTLVEYSSAPLAMNPNALDQAKGIIKSAELKSEFAKFDEILKLKSEVAEEFKSQINEIKNLISELKTIPGKDNTELDKLKNELTDIKADLKKNMEIAAVMTRYRLSFDEKKAIAGGVISELTGRKL